MRIALLTEGGYPYAQGESVVWCDQLLRGLATHEFEICALSRSRSQSSGPWRELPPNVRQVRTAPLWGQPPRGNGAGGRPSRRLGRRYAEHFAELTAALCWGEPGPDRPPSGQADRFAAGLYGMAGTAVEFGGLSGWLRSEEAVRVLEAACRAPGAPRAVHAAQVPDLLAVTERLERALRPLSLDWYGSGADGDEGLAAIDLCHAVGGGPAALPGLLARHFFDTPLLITEYGVRLREHYLSSAASAARAAHAVPPTAAGAPVRALLASFQARLAREAYARATLITPGNTHVRRWQERCGADRDRLRTVYPGLDARPFLKVGEGEAERAARRGTPEREPAPAPTLVWVGRVAPAKDLVGLLHAFAEVRRAEPAARLRIVSGAPGDAGYLAHCRAMAAQLFPAESPDPYAAGVSPVSFEETGGPELPSPAAAYAAGSVFVLSSSVEGFPVPLIEAMFSGRVAVCTEVGSVCEVIGGTGLVVPPHNPRALADACVALLRDPARRARLGAAARARALELFTIERNVAAFDQIYLEMISTGPVRRPVTEPATDPDVPFARPAESHLAAPVPAAPPGWAIPALGAMTEQGPGHCPGPGGPGQGPGDPA
ncbi:DUF3492 domain-containing protein [Streptomyces xiamenensis]|uniref:DUF3492 domain-containing protein n=1 Tax=Streptomyces xiamenensis TaxID=408015 RepID=UPI0037D2B550